MRTPKITAKRALGLTLAGALAVAGTVAVANVSSAATAQSLKLSPATGSSTGGTVVTVTGKDFQTAGGASKIGTVFFSTSACTNTPTATVATASSIVDATKLVVTTPALALTNSKATPWNLCVTTTGDAALLGSAKFTSYLAPFVNTAGLSTTSGASYGGTQIVITGENFTSKTTATIGGKALTNVKVAIGAGTSASANLGDDTLTGTVPAGSGSAQSVVVTSEGGSYTATPTFGWVSAVKASPSYGDGTANRVLTVTGSGFMSKSFSATVAASKSVITLSPAKLNLAVAGAGSTVTGPLCTSFQVVSDTEVNCKLPALTGGANAGPYTVQVVDLDGSSVITAVTAVSRDTTYTVSAF
jgi:hypothetical protein